MDLVLVLLELLGWLLLAWLVVLGICFGALVYGGARNPPWLAAVLHFFVRWARLRGASERKRPPSGS